MIAYPDTSFLCALYRRQDNSERALTHRAGMSEPLHVTRLLIGEFRQSVRFQAFRHGKNPQGGYPIREAWRMLADFGDDIRAGLVTVLEVDMTNILVTGQ